ncbi:MAG: S-adenosylmethionine:tRNA ribosyltransferase-isomerase, partial [Pseudohongiellaceae bacterium]
MNVSDFDFELPNGLIANYPEPNRTDSRLLVLDGRDGAIKDGFFTDILSLLTPNDLLVFNDTKVVPARLYGRKETGGKLEILFERRLDETTFLAHVRSSKSPKEGSKILLEEGFELTMKGRQGALFILQISTTTHTPDIDVFSLLEKLGHIPLPPYIERSDEELDQSRYQTVYAQNPGAAAAPTAGLHFDDNIIDSLKKKGVKTTFVTLHVGAGTFQPVKVEQIKDHVMHSEWIHVSDETVEAIKRAKNLG